MPPERRKRSSTAANPLPGEAPANAATSRPGPKTRALRRMAGPTFVDDIPALFVLPNDLWFEIWRILAPRDRRAAMLVCKRWRAVGLADVRMWAKAYLFTAIHGKGCRCTECTRRKRKGRAKEGLSLPAGWREIPNRLRNQSNVRYSQDLLSRSAGLPLELTVDIMPLCHDVNEVNLLAEAILSQAHRITALSIRCGAVGAYEYLVGHFTSFPNLHTFFAGLLENVDGLYKTTDFACPSLLLPELRTLRLDKGYRWTQTAASAAEVRSLSITPSEDAAQELLSALSACPRLERLRVDLQAYAYDGETWHPPAKNTRSLSSAVPSLQSVEIAGLERVAERWALSSLAPASMQSISLEYASPRDLKDGWQRFGDLRGTAHMRLGHKSSWREHPLTKDRVFAMEIVDESGRSRRLALHACSMETALDAVCCVSRMLDKDLRFTVTTKKLLWPIVACAFEDCGRVRAAELILAAPGDDMPGVRRRGKSSYSLSGTHTLYTADHISIHVPDVTLALSGPGAGLQLQPYEVERIMRTMGIVLPVDTLNIDRRLAGSRLDMHADLSALAHTVLLEECNVPEFVLPAPLRPEPEDSSSYNPGDSD